MEYILSLKWGGIHGDVALQRASGELAYILKGSSLQYHRKCSVVNARGEETFRVSRPVRWFGSAYMIHAGESTLGKAGSNWCRSHGRIDIAGLPVVTCKYGHGFRRSLVLMAGPKEVANMTSQSGLGVQAFLHIKDPAFDDPRFLIACALLFRDWTSRG